MMKTKMMKELNEVQVVFRMSRRLSVAIDQKAEEWNCNRSRVIRRVLEEGLSIYPPSPINIDWGSLSGQYIWTPDLDHPMHTARMQTWPGRRYEEWRDKKEEAKKDDTD